MIFVSLKLEKSGRLGLLSRLSPSWQARKTRDKGQTVQTVCAGSLSTDSLLRSSIFWCFLPAAEVTLEPLVVGREGKTEHPSAPNTGVLVMGNGRLEFWFCNQSSTFYVPNQHSGNSRLGQLGLLPSVSQKLAVPVATPGNG